MTMAFWRRRDVAEAFRSDPQLQQYVLTGVTPTGRVLGTGSYGSVEEVSKLAFELYWLAKWFSLLGVLQTPGLCWQEAP